MKEHKNQRTWFRKGLKTGIPQPPIDGAMATNTHYRCKTLTFDAGMTFRYIFMDKVNFSLKACMHALKIRSLERQKIQMYHFGVDTLNIPLLNI